MEQRRREYLPLVAAALAVLGTLAVDACARTRHRERNESGAADTMSVFPADSPASASSYAPQSPPRSISTFLDSVNMGREVRLTEADVAWMQAAESGRERAGADMPGISAPPLPARSAAPAPARDVYRIQCMATTQSDGLEAARNAIRTKVPYPVHVMHSPPYYKLLVGEFATRADAERALFDVRGCGYPDAWIVRGIAGETTDPGGQIQ